MFGFATTGDDCKDFRFEGSISARRLKKSVGNGGFNERSDTLIIQELLNLIAVKDGGPSIPLKEDGIIGPKTLEAIRNFQRFQNLGTDGRVDPGGALLKRMNDVPKSALGDRNTRLLGKVVQSMPDLLAMAAKGRRTIKEALDFVILGSSGLFAKKLSFDIAELYFRFGSQPAADTIAELQFIDTTFNRINTVLGRPYIPAKGESVFGVNIFTIDPLGKPFACYTPTNAAENNREIPEVHTGHVYVCGSMDTKPNNSDHFTHILFHELVHFVDDEVKERNIEDRGGYREKAMRARHDDRMRNADNYALFASHVHIGRSRLLASQPTLNGLIPAGL